LISQATLAASAQHVVRIGFETIDPSTLSGGLELVPDTASSTAVYLIAHRSSWSLDTYSNFSDFETALAADLNGTTALVQLNAVGPYAAATGVLSVDVPDCDADGLTPTGDGIRRTPAEQVRCGIRLRAGSRWRSRSPCARAQLGGKSGPL
jgi:hypothetical protein